MAAFQPTLAPPGRLVRLGVVLDARGRGGRTTEVARMCDRAGIGAVWMDDSAPPGPPPATVNPLPTGGPAMSPPDPLGGLRDLVPVVARARLGAIVAGGRPVAALDGLPVERLELTLLGDARDEVDRLRGGL
jgi:hypothetical protein